MANNKTISTDSVDVVVGSEAVIPSGNPSGDGKTISTDILKSGTTATVTDGTKTVNFKVKYDKGYEGPKHMEEGSVHAVAPDVAELFESKGMGKIVKD